MPLYSFHCDDCADEFETLVRSSDEPACPKCGSTKLSRHLSLVARPSNGGDAADAFCAGGPCMNEEFGCGANACRMGMGASAAHE